MFRVIMASIYKRENSPFFWIRFKDDSGKWKGKPTKYRTDNIGDQKWAEELAKRTSLKEMLDRPARTAVGRKWEEWVMPWIQTRWGANETRTAKIYTNYFWRWLRYFRENQISHPGALTLKHVEDYFGWRAKRRGSQRTVGNRNTAIGEIKFLRMMMDHAVQQGYATENPAKELVLEKESAKEKNLWEDHEIKLVSDALSQPDKKFGWMHVTFLMGCYQAVRINQCRVPFARIDFRRHEIDYPGQIVVDGKRVNFVKGGEGYVHRFIVSMTNFTRS